MRQSDVDNPLRKLGLYLALAFIFCRFSLLGELVSIKLNFDPHILRIFREIGLHDARKVAGNGGGNKSRPDGHDEEKCDNHCAQNT